MDEQKYHLRIRTDEYLDAHPTLSYALLRAREYQLFKLHVFTRNLDIQVYRDWCDPQKRQAMEQDFDEAQRLNKD